MFGYFCASMQYIRQHIESITQHYDGKIPLTHYLRSYYKQYPKLGSRDRKMLTELAYSWYRCRKGLPEEIPFEHKLVACLELCATKNERLLQLTKQWADGEPAFSFHIEELFPFDIKLSNGMEKEQWLNSMLVQPELFIRIRKNKLKVEQQLKEADIPFKYIDEQCIALPNGAAIDKVLPEYLYAVQDASSQQTGSYFKRSAGNERC